VRLRDTFLHDRYHFAIVFERLGVCLHDFMAKDCRRGLLAETVQSVAQQLLQCLSFIHGLSLTHTDLKCRNVMFRDPRYNMVPLPRVKDAETRKPRSNDLVVIDFGGALFAAERGDGKIGTRHYRAPEVVVGLPWDEKVDCWGAGCMLALAYLGFRPMGADGDCGCTSTGLYRRSLGSRSLCLQRGRRFRSCGSQNQIHRPHHTCR